MTALLRSYVSVMPSTGRPADVDTALLRAHGMTDRLLGHGPILYVFAPHDPDVAVPLIAALLGATATVIDSGTAAQGASRVAINPSLVAP